MTGDDFLKLAIDLFAKSRSPSEALCRTIVSRAYYGAFHVARSYLTGLGFPETDKHRFLADCLQASGEPSVVRAGDLLRILATARGRADYDLTKPHVVKQVQQSDYLKDVIERSHTVTQLISQAASEPAKALAKAGIAAFWSQQPRSPE
jgi:hypothetical protein